MMNKQVESVNAFSTSRPTAAAAPGQLGRSFAGRGNTTVLRCREPTAGPRDGENRRIGLGQAFLCGRIAGPYSLAVVVVMR